MGRQDHGCFDRSEVPCNRLIRHFDFAIKATGLLLSISGLSERMKHLSTVPTTSYRLQMDPHPYSWLSLTPSLVAIALAMVTRKVVLSMMIGIFSGAVITNGGSPLYAIVDTLEIHLWKSLIEEDRLRVFAFTILMGSMITVVQRSGGMKGLIAQISPWARNRQRGQITTWFLGMLVFFDDYANTVLLGKTLQPLSDRLRISREKLAYLVDSTAAPVAGLAIVSTWVAGEISFVEDGLNALPINPDVNAFAIFINSIPYRFYVLFALVFVFLIGFSERDFGPMLKAERKAGSEPIQSHQERDNSPISGWWNAVVPIVGTVTAVLMIMIETGKASLAAEHNLADVSLWQVFGAADSYYALLWGSLAGLVIAILMVWSQRLLSWPEIGDAMATGAKLMLPALLVLWLASCLSAMTGNSPLESISPMESESYPAKGYRLYTGEYLTGLIAGDGQNGEALAAWLPTIIFLLSAVISFSTGTSWGTMAIVMPIAIPLVYGTIATPESSEWQQSPIMLSAVGGVLAGSIFGDHCSPISDTTVLSSQSCNCDHSAHVLTQLPYAIAVAIVSVVFGTIPIGFGVPVMYLLPLGVAGLVAIVYLLGRRAQVGSEVGEIGE